MYLNDSQRDYDETINSQSKIINHHQADIESLRKTISDRELEGNKVLEEISLSKREIDDRESDIYITNRDIEGVRKSNEQLRREIEYVQQDIFQSQDLKKRQSQTLYQLKNDLRFQDKEVDEQKLKVSVLEKEHKTLVERTRHLSDQVDLKSSLVVSTSQKLDSVERDIVVVRQTIHAIDVDINDAERSNDRAIEFQKQLLRQKDQEIVKSQDTSYLLRELEQRQKDADLQIDHLRKDLENVRYSNDALLDRNHDLKLELESLNQHAELLTAQNRELQRELDSFVETDDAVRKNLDRKEKVVQIRQQVDEVIHKSIVDLQQRSPRRNRSPVRYEIQQSSSYQGYSSGGNIAVQQQQQ